MDFPTFYAVGAATVPIILTIIICTAKASAAFGALGSGIIAVKRDVKSVRVKLDDTHTSITNHAKECDIHRMELKMQVEAQEKEQEKQGEKLESQAGTLTKHEMRLGGLEKA